MADTSSPFLETGSQRGPAAALEWVIRRRGFQLLTLIAYALFLNREGSRVPSGNEMVYLLYLWKAWHPHFLAGDWTFKEPTAGHGFFNYTVGWLTCLMSLEKSAWVGRVLCWTLTFLGLMRLGKHFDIPGWGVWLGILIWLAERQALPAAPLSEWIVGTFEAKCPAYICLIFALDAALRNRLIVAGLLAGLGFSFHSAVGLWGGLALGWMILSHAPLRKTVLFSIAAAATALPGFISSLPLILGKHPITPAESAFLVTHIEPLLLDPYALLMPYVVLLLLMIVFGGIYRRLRRGTIAAQLWQFQLALTASFLFAFAARAMGRFDWVKLFPMRVFTVMVPLFFLWQMCWVTLDVFTHRRKEAPVLSAVFGAILFLGMPSPVAMVLEAITSRLHSTRWALTEPVTFPDEKLETTPDFRAAAAWIRQNTPETDLIIAPPWRNDGYYFLRRPLIVNWHAFRYDEMTQWRTRIEQLVGDISNLDKFDPDLGPAHRAHYRNLTAEQILKLQHQYNANWLITTTDYPFEQVEKSGVFKVYRLPPAAPANSN
jgi:hypothetical protein